MDVVAGELIKGVFMFGKYTKGVAAVVTAGIAWATLVVQSAPTAISGSEWIAGATLLAGAFGVYQLANKPAV